MGELMVIAEISAPSCFLCRNYGIFTKKSISKSDMILWNNINITWKINGNVLGIKIMIWEALSNLYYKNKEFSIMQ